MREGGRQAKIELPSAFGRTLFSTVSVLRRFSGLKPSTLWISSLCCFSCCTSITHITHTRSLLHRWHFFSARNDYSPQYRVYPIHFHRTTTSGSRGEKELKKQFTIPTNPEAPIVLNIKYVWNGRRQRRNKQNTKEKKVASSATTNYEREMKKKRTK